MSKLEHCEEDALDILDKEIGDVSNVASIVPLPDKSWEMAVLKSYLPQLKIKLNTVFPDSHIDPYHDPSEPSNDEVCQSGYVKAKSRMIHLFQERAEDVIRDAWPVASTYYSHLLERNGAWLKTNVP